MSEQKFVKPIVEFFPIDIVDSKRGASYELFGEMWNDKTHKYLSGAKRLLMAAHGIYIFYDSRGGQSMPARLRPSIFGKK